MGIVGVKQSIAVLMTCHNRRGKTLRCLRSLRAAAKRADDGRGSLAVDVFLVDDGSTDGTGDAVRECAESLRRDGEGRMAIHLVHGDGNLYWAKGMALAWRESLEFEKRQRNQAEAAKRQRCEAEAENDTSLPAPSACPSSLSVPSASACSPSLPLPASSASASAFSPFSHFLWLNDDVELRDDSIGRALSDWRLADNPEAVIVGACEHGGKCTYGATDSRDSRLTPNGAAQLATGWMNGNFVLVPRAAFEKVGAICADYTHARADYDYAERLKKRGVPFYLASDYVGSCPSDFEAKIAGRGLRERLAWLWRPGYFNLRDLWLVRSRHHGIFRAAASCAHLVLIVVRGPRR